MKKYLLGIILCAMLASACEAASYRGNSVLWKGSPDRKVVALTFDDGPRPEYSAKLLDILDHYGVKATFFVVGMEAEKHPDMLLRMELSGHEIGNHTYSHCSLNRVSRARMSWELRRCNQIIKDITGNYPQYLRAPGGQYNTDILYELNGLDMQMVNWSINSGDYTSMVFGFRLEKEEDKVAQKIIDRIFAKVKNGSIILFHNGSDESVNVLPTVIEELTSRGYDFVTISDMFDESNSYNIRGYQPKGERSELCWQRE